MDAKRLCFGVLHSRLEVTLHQELSPPIGECARALAVIAQRARLIVSVW